MLEIENRPFYRDVSEPLLIARNLVRIYDQVLGEPLPAELLRLVARLETLKRRSKAIAPERTGTFLEDDR